MQKYQKFTKIECKKSTILTKIECKKQKVRPVFQTHSCYV